MHILIFFPISELLEKCREIRNEIIQEEEQYQVNDDITTDSGKGRNKEPFITCNEFIRWFYQFLIPNLRMFFTDICYDFFFNRQTEKKHPVLDQLRRLFLFQLHKLRKNRGKNS